MVAGHCNKRLFNHELFNPELFNPELFNHGRFNHVEMSCNPKIVFSTFVAMHEIPISNKLIIFQNNFKAYLPIVFGLISK